MASLVKCVQLGFLLSRHLYIYKYEIFGYLKCAMKFNLAMRVWPTLKNLGDY
jgi:hypothetical protein